jgi:hypothetical protein
MPDTFDFLYVRKMNIPINGYILLLNKVEEKQDPLQYSANPFTRVDHKPAKVFYIIISRMPLIRFVEGDFGNRSKTYRASAIVYGLFIFRLLREAFIGSYNKGHHM